MFKHLLYRGIADIVCIFDGADPALSVESLQKRLRDANDELEGILCDPTKPFEVQLRECRGIINPVVRTAIPEASGFSGIPREAVERLDEIFSRWYQAKGLLLIGGTCDESYRIQESYASDIVELLEQINGGYASRALALLGKLYGRTSMPLLCESSIAALWDTCRSSFYRRQLSLVSSVKPGPDPLSDPSPSSTNGYSRSRNPQRCAALDATTSPLSKGF